MTAYTIGLRQELKSFGVKVVLVLPGYINTGFPQEVAFDDSSPYAPMMKKVKKVRDALSRNGSPPEVVAKKIWKIVNLKNPSPVYIVGRPGKFTTRLMSLVPESLREKIISRLYNY